MTMYYTGPAGISDKFIKIEDYLGSDEDRYQVKNLFFLDGEEIHPAECWINFGRNQVKLDDKTITLKHISCDKNFRDHLDTLVRKFCFESLMPEEEEE